MADPNHVAILKKGVDSWNEWRRSNPHIRPNLSSADFGEADLRGVDLREAGLSSTRLHRANLTGADLAGADLQKAILSKVDFSEANLIRARFTGANLREANFSGANLREANFGGTWLRKGGKTPMRPHVGRIIGSRAANLAGANFTQANLTGANLAETGVGIGEIARARTLYKAVLSPRLLAAVQQRYPRLLEEPGGGDAMTIASDIRDGVVVLTITGSVEADDLPHLHHQIADVLQDGFRNLVVDLCGIPHVSGPMVGVMAAVLVSLRQEGGDLRIIARQPAYRVLELVRAFLLFETVDQAVASYTDQQ